MPGVLVLKNCFSRGQSTAALHAGAIVTIDWVEVLQNFTSRRVFDTALRDVEVGAHRDRLRQASWSKRTSTATTSRNRGDMSMRDAVHVFAKARSEQSKISFIIHLFILLVKCELFYRSSKVMVVPGPSSQPYRADARTCRSAVAARLA
jgi:hypothetical protein